MSTCHYKSHRPDRTDGQLHATFREPFDQLAEASRSSRDRLAVLDQIRRGIRVGWGTGFEPRLTKSETDCSAVELFPVRRLQRDRRRPAGVLVPDARGRGRRPRDRDHRGHGAAGEAPLLQQKFLEHAALQCGFCTPGLLIASKALLERNPDPTETEIRYWIAGNLCRCTGYNKKIVRAVLDAAAEMRAG